ncbi:MAG: hypothetical protein AABM66_12615 [Actinomycetota bacterium]
MLLVAALSACGNGETSGNGTTKGVLVVYQQSGGVAGRDDHLTVRRSGEVQLRTLVNTYRCRMGDRRLHRLKRLLTRVDFRPTDEDGQGQGSTADVMDYEITYRGATIAFTSLTIDQREDRAVSLLNKVLTHCERPANA